MTTERLFNPFWDSIAIVAVKDLLVRPQATQLMADILGISVPEFLVLTQSNTLPYLVLSGQIEIITRIAHGREGDAVYMLCWENLVPILALLLVQNVPDIETSTISLLRAVSQRFKDADFTDLMRIDPAVLALRLLKVAGQATDSMKSRVCILL